MKFVLVPKKCIVFELARKIEPIEIFEEIGIKFLVFDRNIYFDTKKGRGASKNDGDPSRCYIWIELKEGHLTYCRAWSSSTENFRKMLREGNYLRDAEGMKEIYLGIVSEIKDILEDVEGHNLKVQEEIDRKAKD